MSEPSNETIATTDRRAQHVAALGFVLQLASAGTLMAISFWSGSDAAGAVARFIIVGLPIWLILFLTFKQLRRVRAEALETAELRRAREAGTNTAIFGLDDEGMLLEQDRLRWMVRWLLPAVTVALAIYLIAGHFLGWGWTFAAAFSSDQEGRVGLTEKPTLMMWFVVGIGFLCFLYARYAIALSRTAQWRLLRAGATCMAGNALACLGLSIALMAGTTFEWAEALMACLTRWALLILGVEMTANFVFDFYRPRTAGVVQRPSFDSRLLGLTSDPGGIAKSIADAVNYQFGFEVSSTWFYQLLQRWLFPIMVFTLAAVLAMTSIVTVESEEQVVIERFGRLVERPNPVLSAGLHFKWPYPIDVAYRAPVKQISELVIGEATEDDREHQHEAIVWTEAHEYVPEMMMLVASPQAEERFGEARKRKQRVKSDASVDLTASVAVSLLMVSVPIEYRIKDIRQYLYNYVDPARLLEGVAYQYLSDYAASVDIDELMGPGRQKFNGELKSRIQRRLDDLGTGIDVVFVGIRGAHPPAKNQVAASFQAAVAAQTNMAATINAARAEARKILTQVAGTQSRADTLDQAIQARDRLQGRPGIDAARLALAQQRVEDLLVGDPAKGLEALGGAAAGLIAEARANASEQINLALAKVRAFGTEVAAYVAAPTLYTQRKALEVYENLETIRKYLIVGNPRDVLIEYQAERVGGLDEVLREGVKDGN